MTNKKATTKRKQILRGEKRKGQGQSEPQIPFGNDKQKATTKRKQILRVGKRKGQGQSELQIPFGNDKQRSDDKAKADPYGMKNEKVKGKGTADSLRE